MVECIFSIKIEPNIVYGHYIQKKNYRSKKHGIVQHKDKLDYKLTRKEINWYGRNYLDMWCFVH